MWLPVVFALPLIIAANGIKVPIDRPEEVSDDEGSEGTEGTDQENPTQVSPTYYISEDNPPVNSYLLPPASLKPEALPDVIVTPATYLLPPTQGAQHEYYETPEPDAQTDWYPIAQAVPQIPVDENQSQPEIPVNEHKRRSKSQFQISNESGLVPIPSTDLQPPLLDARNDYFAPTPTGVIHLEEIRAPIDRQKLIPLEEIQRPINVPNLARYELPIVIPKKELHLNYRARPIEPTLSLHLIPPQPTKYKIPTKLYPKKFGGEFKPVPLPIAQYADESTLEIPRAKPAKLLKPLPSAEIDYLTPTDEKINYLYRKAENKRKLKGEKLSNQEAPSQVSLDDAYNKYSKPVSTEQEASESIHRHPGRNHLSPAPARPAPSVPQHDAAAPAPDERTEFRMHGMKGPHSYQFGFDTGKGKNRQFRYEERDNDGQVRGHYGYMDKHGKLRVVNYSADPKNGFHAEAPAEKE